MFQLDDKWGWILIGAWAVIMVGTLIFLHVGKKPGPSMPKSEDPR